MKIAATHLISRRGKSRSDHIVSVFAIPLTTSRLPANIAESPIRAHRSALMNAIRCHPATS